MSQYQTRSKGKAQDINYSETPKRKATTSPSKRTTKKSKNEKKKEEKEKKSEILEKGLIYFFYRPKIDSTEVEGLEDISKLYILLSSHALDSQGEPIDTAKSSKNRLIGISKKKLPQLKQHGKYWGYIIKTADTIEEIVKTEFGEKDYSTQTRGIRHIQSLRPVGEGVYAICTHGDHTHLVYVLEQPEKLGEVQHAFNIEKEGSYVVSVKNPEQKSGWGSWESVEKGKPKYPENLKEIFTGKRGGATKWHPANPVQLLDFDGGEIILIGAREDIVEELGETGEYIEELEKIDAKRISDDKLFQELHLDKKKFFSDPLLKGEWK